MSPDERFDDTIDAARAGQPWALARLYDDLQPRVLRYLRALEPGVAEDLASDTWLGVAEGLRRFTGDEDRFRGWVFTIARRRVLDHRRRGAGRRTLPVRPGDLTRYGDLGNVEDEAMALLGTDAALAHIASLPQGQAEVVLLRVLADLPVAEVARILGKRPGTVRVLQHRALRRLAATISRNQVTE